MNPKKYYEVMPAEKVRQVCKAAGTTFENFQQFACYAGTVSGRLAIRLAMASENQMTIEEILILSAQNAELRKLQRQERQFRHAKKKRIADYA